MSTQSGNACPQNLSREGKGQAGIVEDHADACDAGIDPRDLSERGSQTDKAGDADAGSKAPPTLEAALQQPVPQPTFRSGDMVTIFQIALFRYPFIESRAGIVAPVPGCPHEYFVQFPGDPRVRRRFVLSGDFQRTPEAMLEMLRAVWRVGTDPAIVEEFFTDRSPANDNEEGKR